MANSILTINMITRLAVRLWKNTNAFMRNISTQYDDQYARTGAKIGSSLRIRLPNDYVVGTGPAVSVQDTAEQSTTLTLATQNNIGMSFSSVDLTMSIDDFAERFIAPAVNNLAGAVAVGIMSGSEGGVSNYVDNQAAGVIITPSSTTFLTSGAILDIRSAPAMNRRIVDDPFTDSRVVGSLAGLFNPTPEIGSQYRSGEMKNALGFDWMRDQTVLKHTPGTFSAGTVTSAGVTGTSIPVTTTGTFTKGDIITIDGVNSVNRITKQSDGQLQQFVVLANYAAGAGNLSVYPALIPAVAGNPVQYQTVTASPANAAAIHLLSPASTTYRKNIAFVPDAVTMATADLDMPNDVQGAREEFDGVSMRMVRQYAVGTDQSITRLDVLWGALWVRPEWAVVVADAV